MTTNVTVKPHNYPTKVTVRDEYSGNVTESVEYLKAGEEKTYYCTTDRTISAADVDYSEVEGSREAAGQ